MTVNEIPDIFPTVRYHILGPALLTPLFASPALHYFAGLAWPGLAWCGLLNILGNICTLHRYNYQELDWSPKNIPDYNILQNSPLTFPRAGCRTDTVQTLQAGSGLSQSVSQWYREYREFREYYVTWEERGEGWWGAPLNSNASLTLVCSLTWSLFVDNQLERELRASPLTHHSVRAPEYLSEFHQIFSRNRMFC